MTDPTVRETLAEWNEQDRAEKAAWLAAHPDVTAAKPGWAATVSIDWEKGTPETLIMFDREFGPVILTRSAMWLDGELTWLDGTAAPEVVLLRGFDEGLTVEQMRELASALMAAIPVAEAALEEVQP